ncbi:MAG: gamma-glutamylcyclotransferase [Pandoraea sp.]|nr:gamma-glutamylcyclotransferase [Pandoraea sp.]MDR3399555.1 gamma-glutamylcyclotransferase [Pandoraea sp.]
MLTRQAIHSGAYFESFEASPNRWTIERIESSLKETLARRPGRGNDVWIFAYGSLMWNPAVKFDARRVASLDNWHRAFCLRMEAGRATAERPGRMLALRPGGSTQGLALRLAADTLDEELRLVWVREMVLGSYRPTWVSLALEGGETVDGIAFVADESRDQYESDASVATVAPLIHQAHGRFGSNAEYLSKLHAALHAWGLRDPYVQTLESRVGRPEPTPGLAGSIDFDA